MIDTIELRNVLKHAITEAMNSMTDIQLVSLMRRVLIELEDE